MMEGYNHRRRACCTLARVKCGCACAGDGEHKGGAYCTLRVVEFGCVCADGGEQRVYYGHKYMKISIFLPKEKKRGLYYTLACVEFGCVCLETRE
jgi:hypothetical protein